MRSAGSNIGTVGFAPTPLGNASAVSELAAMVVKNPAQLARDLEVLQAAIPDVELSPFDGESFRARSIANRVQDFTIEIDYPNTLKSAGAKGQEPMEFKALDGSAPSLMRGIGISVRPFIVEKGHKIYAVPEAFLVAETGNPEYFLKTLSKWGFSVFENPTAFLVKTAEIKEPEKWIAYFKANGFTATLRPEGFILDRANNAGWLNPRMMGYMERLGFSADFLQRVKTEVGKLRIPGLDHFGNDIEQGSGTAAVVEQRGTAAARRSCVARR